MDDVHIDIEAPAEAIYDLVADITNMGRWSPETYRAEWVDGATAPVVGARFKGWNKQKILGLPAKWSTTSVIRQADRGRAFSFDTPLSGARWTYRFEPTDTGCRVTESRELVRVPMASRFMDLFIGSTRDRQVTEGMEETLNRLKEAAELEASAL
ncbi:MAG: SRPBCC family protein [Aquihabitans sp.]